MKNTYKLIIVLFSVAIVGFTVKLNAQSITDQDLLEVASGVNMDVQHTDIGSVNVQSKLELNEAVQNSALNKLSSVRTSIAKTTSIVTDGPEGVKEGTTEGPDLDGPGGSTHEFNGEETGNH